MLTTIAVQAANGYHHFELAPVSEGLSSCVLGIQFVLLVVLALFLVQVVTNNRYVGFLSDALYFVSLFVLPALHFEHHLYQLRHHARLRRTPT